MIAFSEILKSLTPVKKIFTKGAPFRKHFIEKITDLLAIIISIYLALSIEGWAEKRNEHKKLIHYYKNIVAEIEKDTVELVQTIVDAEKHIKNENEHIELLNNYQPELEDSVKKMFQGMISTIIFSSSQMVSYQSMVISGDIKLIENFQIRESLIGLEEEYKGLKLWEDIYSDFFRNELMNAFFRSNDWIEGKLIDKAYFTKPEYSYLLVKSITFNTGRLEVYKNTLIKAKQTHELILKELDKNK